MNNQSVIERFYRTHKDELIAFVSSRLHNTQEAEDMVHETFLRLLCDSHPIAETTLGALAYTLCRRQIADWYRHSTVMADAEHELRHQDRGMANAESVLSVRDITEQLERSMARLPEECRQVYRLHIYGGMKTADICQATGMKYKNVEYRLGIARKEIRNKLKHIS